MVQLFPPVLAVPALLGLLPLRHRHRGNLHGRARNHGRHRVGQKYCNEIIGKVYKIGNNLGLPEPALADTLEGLEEDIEDETGVSRALPLDEKAPRCCWSRRLPISSPNRTSMA